MRTQAKQVLKLEVARREAKESELLPAELTDNPLYGVAMLKIAMELKRGRTEALDDILGEVLRKMKLPEAEFRDFLSKNGGLLKAIAARRGY